MKEFDTQTLLFSISSDLTVNQMGAQLVFLVTFIVNLIIITVSQDPCVTPNGENGNCIPFQDCEPFAKIWKDRTSKNIGFFRQSHCGFKSDKPLVCCGTVAEFTTIVSITRGQTTTESSTAGSATTERATTERATTESATTERATTERATTESITTKPITLLPIPIPISMLTPELSTEITTKPSSSTPELFTSAISTNTPPTTKSVPVNRSKGIQNHRNFNLLPPPPKCGLQTAGEKITNGNETDLDEYPWLAMLLYRQDNGQLEPNCGGSLINTKYVLTAAHCITGNLFSVRLGEYNVATDPDCVIQEDDTVCGEPAQEFEVDDFVMPRGYSNRNRNRHHDIALVRMKGEAIISDFVRPICLPLNNERSDPGQILFASGWGVTEKNVSSTVKLAVSLQVWSDVSCKEIYSRGFNYNLTSMQLCAGGGPDEKDSCTGDSGGPLMQLFPNAVEFYVEGIVSFGPTPCGRVATPGVYIRVSEYVTWILDNMIP